MIFDAQNKSIIAKIVYFGPALSGKTTSLKALFRGFGKEEDVISIESSIGRTLFFDFGTITFKNDVWSLKLHLYSVTGQDFYIGTRPITLKAVDGIIFVADSQKDALSRNIISWQELNAYFEELENLPLVIAFNKQDLPNLLDKEVFLENIDFVKYEKISNINTIATTGEGIVECFEDILRIMFKEHCSFDFITST